MAQEKLHARDLMTADMISVAPDTEVQEIARLLLECHITGVPVIDTDGRLLGMVSETDLERDASGPHARATDVMSYGAVTVPEDAGLDDIAKVFDERRIRRVVVVRTDGRPRGILTRSDLLLGVARGWEQAGLPPDADMDLIRQRVADVLNEYGGAASTVKVVIVEGVAHLWGIVESENERRAVHGAVAAVPGVLGIDNHLVIHRGTLA